MRKTRGTEIERAEARTRFEATIGLYLADCYAARADVRVKGLAQRVGICRQRLNKELKRAFGKTALQVLRERQFEYVIHLLVTTTLDLPEIATASGFGHRATLSRLFLEKYGMTPGKYRGTEMRRRKRGL